MAVDSFIRGKRYKFKVNDLTRIGVQQTLFFSYLKITTPYGHTATYRGYFSIYDDGSSWELDTFYSPTNYGASSFGWLLSSATVEFIYDYMGTTTRTIGDDWKAICDELPDEFAQVSIYNEYNGEWVDLPCASEYTGIATTIVDSGRNASGVVIADPIASDIAKVEMKWNFLTLEQYSKIAQLFEPKYNGAFMNAVRFFDVVKGDFDGNNSSAPDSSTNPCRVMYCGDRKVSFARMKLDEDGKPIGYQGVSLNLIDTHKMYGE